MKEQTSIEVWSDIPSVLTVKEVAALMRVHENTVYNWIRSKRIIAFKVGRAWRIHKSELWWMGMQDA